MLVENPVPKSLTCLPGRAVGACRRGQLRVRLVQISFFRLCPSTSTHAKVGHRPQLCHPDWSGPGFPTSRYRPRRRMRLSVRKAARSSPTPLSWTGNPGERRGGTCSFTWTARKCRQAIHHPNPILFERHAPPTQSTNLPAHRARYIREFGQLWLTISQDANPGLALWLSRAQASHNPRAPPGSRPGLARPASPGNRYSRWPVPAGAMPAWLAASAPITGSWKVLPW